MFNLLQFLTTKNLGITLLILISFIILAILFLSIYNYYLKRKLKNIKSNRRVFKNGKSRAYYFDKLLIEQFKSKFGKKSNISLNLEKLIINFLEKENKSKFSKNNLKLGGKYA